MINNKVDASLNAQINKELFSSYLYLSMAAYFEGRSLSGFASWMRLQSAEEYGHAMKFYNYLLTKGGKVQLDAIEKPQADWKSTIDVFEATYKHEQFISASINDLVGIAMGEKDFATVNFLNWFVTEQVEEEATVCKILDDLKLIGDNNSGTFMLDRELGQRQPSAPEAAE